MRKGCTDCSSVTGDYQIILDKPWFYLHFCSNWAAGNLSWTSGCHQIAAICANSSALQTCWKGVWALFYSLVMTWGVIGTILRFPQGIFKLLFRCLNLISVASTVCDILNNDALGRDFNDLSGSSDPPVTSVPRSTQKIVSCEGTAVKTVYPA